MIIPFQTPNRQHQSELLEDAAEIRRERQARGNNAATIRPGFVLVPAGNGTFRWSDERDRAA